LIWIRQSDRRNAVVGGDNQEESREESSLPGANNRFWP
jgi:hypothetical protein